MVSSVLEAMNAISDTNTNTQITITLKKLTFKNFIFLAFLYWFHSCIFMGFHFIPHLAQTLKLYFVQRIIVLWHQNHCYGQNPSGQMNCLSYLYIFKFYKHSKKRQTPLYKRCDTIAPYGISMPRKCHLFKKFQDSWFSLSFHLNPLLPHIKFLRNDTPSL